MSSVYTFNVFNQPMTLSLNGMPIAAGSIQAWQSSPTNRYQPFGVAVRRVLNASEGGGNFFNGSNSVTIEWLDGLYAAQVRLDGSVSPLSEDLILFIDRSNWRLVSQFGTEVSSGPVMEMQFLQKMLAEHKTAPKA